MHAAAAAKSLQPCPTLCDPIDGSPPGSTIPGILYDIVLVSWRLDKHFPESLSTGTALWTGNVWPLEGQWTRASQADPADGPLCHLLHYFWGLADSSCSHSHFSKGPKNPLGQEPNPPGYKEKRRGRRDIAI